MADAPQDTPGDGRPDEEPQTPDVVFGTEADESSVSRRAASAEFVVESSVGSEVLLREAMDPANQSLRDALRLSYRVLQLVIAILVGLFIVSGIKTVDTSETGVMLRWGKILSVGGSKALDPGLHFSKWPYPAGEFVLFRSKNRTVDLREVFSQSRRPGESFEEAVENASLNYHLRPGRDGSILSRDADIAHVRLTGEYEIDDPVAFVTRVENENPQSLDADRLVSLAMQRAMVHAAARMNLREITDLSEQSASDLQASVQQMLDEVGRRSYGEGTSCGIRIARVTPTDPTPALAIRKTFGELQETKAFASQQVEAARQDADGVLIASIGEQYGALLDLIDQYESSLETADESASSALLDAINERMESPETSGEVSEIISRARSYRSTIESTLGNEAKRFNSILPSYRENPRLVVSQLWSSAYATVLGRADAEPFYVPPGIGAVRIDLSGYDHVRQKRRDERLKRTESRAYIEGLDVSVPFIRRSGDIRLTGPGRQLDRDAKGLGRSGENR